MALFIYFSNYNWSYKFDIINFVCKFYLNYKLLTIQNETSLNDTGNYTSSSANYTSTNKDNKIPYNKELLYNNYNDDYFSLYFDGRLYRLLNEFSFLGKFGLFCLYKITETTFSKIMMYLLPPNVYSFTILPLSFYLIYICYLNFGGYYAIILFIVRSIIEVTKII